MLDSNKPICVACSIFKREIDELIKSNKLDLDVKYLSSMLHMKPEQLQEELEKEFEATEKIGKKTLLVFGDCSPHMTSFESCSNIARTEGINCIEIFLGKEKYRQLRKDGVFFLMPEWTLRWKEVFKHELKLDHEIVRDFMKDFHSKIIYLDTGQIDIPTDHIKEIENYTGLKVEIMKAEDRELAISIKKELKKLDKNNNQRHQ